MASTKHRTQISLDDWQYHLLLVESRKTKKSISQIIRDLISDKFHPAEKRRKKQDTLFDIIGIGAGDGSSVARDHDKYLYGTKRITAP